MKLNLPSPVQEVHNPHYLEKGVRVFVKRDDLIHPLISGNKWRKLKFILSKAQREAKNHLVTFGGAYSNHLLACAAAANYNGLPCTGIVRGEDVKNEILYKCTALGMKLIFVDRESYRYKHRIFEDLFGKDDQAYFIDEGGASEQAVEGCEEIVNELVSTFDHILCAAGTGSTAAGILAAIKKQKLSTRLQVIPVLKDGDFLKQAIEKYTAPDASFELHQNYHFGGYAKYNDQLLDFIIDYYKQHHILLDQVYTAKLVFGLDDLIRSDFFKPGEQLLWIHTGGKTGLLGIREKLTAKAPEFRQILEEIL